MRQWIICCYIMQRLIGCGALSLGFLRFHGFTHVRCQIFYLVGGIGWGSILLTSGTQFHCVWCGVVEGNAIGRCLRIWIDPRTKCLLSILVPFLIGLGFEDSHLVTIFLFSLSLFLCNLCFLCILFSHLYLYFWYVDAILHLAVFLNIFFLTYQKKKKNNNNNNKNSDILLFIFVLPLFMARVHG